MIPSSFSICPPLANVLPSDVNRGYPYIIMIWSQVSSSQEDKTNLEQDLELANDHMSRLEAQHQEAIDKTTELEEKVQAT